jgi:hypothetical protein
VALSALDIGHVGALNARPFGQLLLRESQHDGMRRDRREDGIDSRTARASLAATARLPAYSSR